MTVEQCWQRVPGGSATYIVELARALRARSGLTVAGLAAYHRGPPPEDWAPPIPVRHVPMPRTALYAAWNTLRGPRAELTAPADVVHATTWAIPPTRRPLVVTVHDLAFERAPEHFTARGVAYFRRALHRASVEADAIVVPSRATWDDCVGHGIEPARLRLVPHGVRVPPRTGEDVARFRTDHGISRPYVLWSGTSEPRKNLPTLLEAFAAIAPASDLDLVLVGPRGWGDDPVPALAPGIRARVHRLGRLAALDLASAYAGAAVFAFPSLWEGFGLPVLEAMAYGTPVVTSMGTSMAELVDGGGYLVPATDAGALAARILEAVDPANRPELSASAVRAARRRTWDEAARATADVYAQAAGRARGGDTGDPTSAPDVTK